MLCMNELELRHDLRDRSGEIKSLVKKISKKNSSKYYLITRGKRVFCFLTKEKYIFQSSGIC